MREMWINGALLAAASGQTIPVQDPATEEVIDSVPAGNAEDVRAAVDAASAAFQGWRRLSAGERAEMLHEVAAKLTAEHRGAGDPAHARRRQAAGRESRRDELVGGVFPLLRRAWA